ncbi:MAG: stage II sporulation protein D [Eubacteriales bacterium]|nr:stage II sporulation protein D [Eubacteriales bacterium]
MKTVWKEICASILMGAVLPGLILNLSAILLEGSAQELPIVESVPETYAAEKVDRSISIRFLDGSVSQMDMDAYLTGVVLGEMPADFESEALKAQAVAARTYTAKAANTGGKHGDGSLCTDSTCCQAYVSEETYLGKGGTEENLEKVRRAVLDTSGQVLTYEGELIEATYFSCSGGSTEDAVAVWGTDYPYLRAVASPGEENAAHYCDTISFTTDQFQEKTGCTLTGASTEWFVTESYTQGGGIESMSICGEQYTGTQLRQLLGLPSTVMTLSVAGDTITITTRGYGHRVGMSQYGADAMAATGSNFIEILAHYYPGTELVQLS